MLGKVQLMASNKKTLAAVEGFPSRPPNALPAYQRIQSVIRKRIDSGQLQAGDPVPSERELATTHHVSLERLRHASGEPFALEICYLRAAEFPGLLGAPVARESLFGILERDYKVELGYADEEVDATAADPRIADLLAIPRREPLLRIRQVIYSAKGKAIMYVLGFYRSDRHNLVIRRFR